MALFVFGAGATRGCSFVDESRDPCLPPLDGDFFTQLQRVQNRKHRKLVRDVMADVVDMFGPNFDVTMETVFTTLEHTIKMVTVARENRAFIKQDLVARRERLEQAIAVVLEDSLAERDPAGGSKHTPRLCEFHECFVKDILRPGDDIITFNYDCVLDFTLKYHGDKKWNSHYGYGFDLGAKGTNVSGDDFWQPKVPASKDSTVHLFKLHGSLHFNIADSHKSKPKIELKRRPYTKQAGDKMHFTIIPPESQKTFETGAFTTLWKKAAAAVHKAKSIVFIGYSFPEADLHAAALFRTSVSKTGLKSLIVVNPDRAARRRSRTLVRRGITEKTKVLSFERLAHFNALSRDLWVF